VKPTSSLHLVPRARIRVTIGPIRIGLQGVVKENLRETDHWEDIGVEGRIVLKLISKKHMWNGFIWLRNGNQ
jgi:hypothetical protein